MANNRCIDSGELADRLVELGVLASCVASHDEALEIVSAEAKSGDAVIVMGARDPELPALARRIVAEIASANTTLE